MRVIILLEFLLGEDDDADGGNEEEDRDDLEREIEFREEEVSDEADIFENHSIGEHSTCEGLKGAAALRVAAEDIGELKEEEACDEESTAEGYEIGEIDYVFGEGTRRLSAVFYWHKDEGAQWGEFGLFLTMHKEPVSSQHQEMYASVSSLRLVNGEHEVWRGLNQETPEDKQIRALMHVELEATRLQMFGLDVRQLESEVRAQLPVSAEGLENIVIKMP